jgi:hypothetical protein
MVLMPAAARKGVYAYVLGGLREAVLPEAAMVAVCWMVAMRPVSSPRDPRRAPCAG